MKSGIYEAVINKAMSKELAEWPDQCKNIKDIDKKEASEIISKYTGDVIKSGLDNLFDRDKGIEQQVQLANNIIELVRNYTSDD
ncbi:hypothetical protein NZ47_04500, partial [Anaerovibrio lipolyticus]